MSSRNMASVLALAACGVLVAAGCAAQTEDPKDQTDEQQLAAPVEEAAADPATTAGEENVGEAKEAWGWGGWGGWGRGWGGGWGGWGGGWGGWGGWGGYPGWGWGGGWGGWGGYPVVGWGYPVVGWGGWW